ncbi:MarR family winged helix-turn-helix transcriptional regulator [Aerococcus urinaeequi]|uniref:MarR family winged helix-turn-helix transcriptional regulator n=1 Tax=Aerococcus urinaeequi TaxID=51665 RepID=UPI003F5CF5F4
MKLSYLYVLYAISKLEENVRITDVSKEMLISSPNITALVNEMEKKGFVIRERSQTDKRVSYITSTKEGKELLDKYYLQYKKEVASSIDISEEDLMTTIETLIN